MNQFNCAGLSMVKNDREIKRLEKASALYSSDFGKINARLISLSTVKLLNRISVGKKILLMGLGDGLVYQGLLSKKNLKVTVIEGSKRVIDKYKVSNNNCTIIHSLFEEYQPNCLFDAIIGTHVLEHVHDPVGIARTAKNWCKRGGIGIFTVPNADSLHRRIGVAMGLISHRGELNDRDIASGHRRVYNIEKLKSDLGESGWFVKETKGYILKVLSNEQMKRFKEEYLNAVFEISLEMPPEYCSSLMAICINA